MELNSMGIKEPGQNRLKKIFGIGPAGATASLILLAVFVWVDSMVKLPIVMGHSFLMSTISIALILMGLGLHIWSFSTLRNWWVDDQLCTKGPFKYFRHPMYAGWITFIATGAALYLNSWVYLFWLLLLHLLWHRLVKKEEAVMIAAFGDTYRDYANQTGRFFPKL